MAQIEFEYSALIISYFTMYVNTCKFSSDKIFMLKLNIRKVLLNLTENLCPVLYEVYQTCRS